mgnify:CR=1 FL=1
MKINPLKSRKIYGDECIYAEITDKTENMLYRAKMVPAVRSFYGECILIVEMK